MAWSACKRVGPQRSYPAEKLTTAGKKPGVKFDSVAGPELTVPFMWRMLQGSRIGLRGWSCVIGD